MSYDLGPAMDGLNLRGGFIRFGAMDYDMIWSKVGAMVLSYLN